MSLESPPIETLPFLKSLPLAPEYHPTLSEFQDPIAYILKIEKQASAYGICKIVPPLPSAPRKTAFANLNKSFAARQPNPNPHNNSSRRSPTFSTRHQQVGFCPRRPRPVQKPVWQSGDCYTLNQFEAKARQFELSYLSSKRKGIKSLRKKGCKLCSSSLAPLELETLYWRACADKPFSVEYANDVPGSGFPPISSTGRRWREEEAASNVGETAWNMRGVSRAKGSLLRFMKEEIPGVTSPMVYVAMMFSWFAWHVEDHELHSLNYLHLGAGKTWYGVPRDAALAFEDVVRVHGYCGEVNPLSESFFVQLLDVFVAVFCVLKHCGIASECQYVLRNNFILLVDKILEMFISNVQTSLARTGFIRCVRHMDFFNMDTIFYKS